MNSELPQFITWLLVIAGWLVVNDQNNKRETRKEIRLLLDKIYTSLIELEKDAFQFHTSDFNDRLANEIIRRMNRLAVQITTTALLDTPRTRQLYELRQAITLKNFDRSTHKAVDLNDELLQEIVTSQQELFASLESAFSLKYY